MEISRSNKWKKLVYLSLHILLIAILLPIWLDKRLDKAGTTDEPPINVVLVVCGNKLFNLSTNFLKTSFLFTEQKTKFTLFANQENKDYILNELNRWPIEIREKHIVEFRKPTYPNKYKDWVNLFGPCATLRLFISELMPDVDSAIYLDIDTLVLSDFGDLWTNLKRFNRQQMIGLAQEREEFNEYKSWYHKSSIDHPFIQPHGMNSGVLLMNLTRMRDFSFVEKIALIYEQYKDRIIWFDQDLINILGYFNPKIIYKLDCGWNFRSCHCNPSLNCPSVERRGPKIVHGNADRFFGCRYNFSMPEVSFQKLYTLIDKFNFTNSMKSLISGYKQAVKDLEPVRCSKYADLLIKPLIRLNVF